ncbi:MAG: hypothetical protein HY007_03795 [Candidatus Sungbacteria bacterium]|nr:hypothetical protein [Candidatus Sungbacteria bacterium]
MENGELKIGTVIKWIVYSICVGFIVLQGTLLLRQVYNCKNFGGSLEFIACESSQLFTGSFFGAVNVMFLGAPVVLFASIALLLGLTWEKRRMSRTKENKKMS